MTSKDFEIKSIESTVLNVPFHPRCAKVKEVRVPFWSLVDVIEVTLSCGVKGIGETLTRYTWAQSDEYQFKRIKGKNLFDFLWDDDLGAGLQMALFDAAGKAMGVPCHRLLGVQYRDACPVSWWTQDRIPVEWAEEAKAAEEHGFTSMKVKARPWFDPEKQLAAVCEVVSPHFKLDMDFNGLLLGVDQAAPLIRNLEEKYSNLAIVETPIPQSDVNGNSLLRRKIQSPIAMHFGNPPVMTAIREGVCDGFVIGGGASCVISQGTLAEHVKMPFWLQMVGTGLTTMFSVHLGAVLSHARWPAIPCINIFSNPLIKGFRVEGGCLRVPEDPGLGIEVDRDAIENFRVESDFKLEIKRQIHTINWPDGKKAYYSNGSYRQDFLDGKILGFLPGISLDLEVDDGSKEFDQRYRDFFS
ncbi:MAG: Mandelate racemase [Candidatus Moanabacter tarae]|uniref:Mandelate racemase n=1 Tax=Candidatus Moanibacter tarae TaxID=2200854 RepID=A0A2Z4ALJ4_9BACT|nr:MAG: Mandelate racemase [Candidatus Moanabacter tarae]|tara:strand:+ start:28510 stop:29748 length:1239 start_codon:yes stop_codon:yes gene_type:complete